MIDTQTSNLKNLSNDAQNFTFVLGGPLFQLLRRAHLSDDSFGLLRRRMLIISLLAWLPLLIFSTLEGNAYNHTLPIPFLFDIEIHARYLLALPLLIYAEYLVNNRMRPIVRQFSERNLVDEPSELEGPVHSAFRLRNSVAAELILIAIVYSVGILVRRESAVQTSTWYAIVKDGTTNWTKTGLWYAYASLPIFQFLLIRWYFRLFIWGRFLWQVSKLKLNLIPTHPDRVGGLGFLGNTVYAFAPILMAHGVLLSGMIANRIFYTGAKLVDFKLEIFAMLIVLLVIVLIPLLVFAPKLNQAKRTGLREYGILAQRYVREFDQKWLRSNTEDEFLGSGDIQSLADFGNSFQVIREMRLYPFTKETIGQLAIFTLIPVLPLVLTMFSLEQLLDRFLGTVF
jgi:hypothetical protein